jgi:hypothetical protein
VVFGLYINPLSGDLTGWSIKIPGCEGIHKKLTGCGASGQRGMKNGILNEFEGNLKCSCFKIVHYMPNIKRSVVKYIRIFD